MFFSFNMPFWVLLYRSYFYFTKKTMVMGVFPVSGCYNINIRLIPIYKLLGSLLGLGVWGSGSINVPCKN